jgi:hypothetical protein
MLGNRLRETPYSSQSESAGGCEVQARGDKYQLFAPSVMRDPTRRRFPIPVQTALKVAGADE